jgi:hypothetical protein
VHGVTGVPMVSGGLEIANDQQLILAEAFNNWQVAENSQEWPNMAHSGPIAPREGKIAQNHAKLSQLYQK